jgi:hypothetical protein
MKEAKISLTQIQKYKPHSYRRKFCTDVIRHVTQNHTNVCKLVYDASMAPNEERQNRKGGNKLRENELNYNRELTGIYQQSNWKKSYSRCEVPSPFLSRPNRI